MKNIILILFICLAVKKNYAQTKLTPGDLKGKNYAFHIDTIQKFYGDTVGHFGVYNKINKYLNGIPRSEEEKKPTFLPMNQQKDVHVDLNMIKQTIFTVLNNKLSSLKNNKETLDYSLVFDPNGTLLNIDYILKNNTLISLEDIETIDTRLRQSIKVSFTGTQFKYYTAISYNNTKLSINF